MMKELEYPLLIAFISAVLLLCGCFISTDHPNAVKPINSMLSVSCEVITVQVNKNPDVDEMDVNVFMKIHFKNQGSIPLLIYFDKDYPWLMGESLASTKGNLLSKKNLFASGGGLSFDYSFWNKVRLELDKKAPATELIRIIDPSAEWTIEKTVPLAGEIKASFDEKATSWNKIKRIDPLWLQLDFEVWPFNLDHGAKNSGFGKRLQERWKKYGYLVLQDVSSEPIPIHLPATDES